MARRASPSSVGRGARTRTPSRGLRSPTPSGRRTVTPSSATACRPRVLGLPRATIDETAAGGDRRPARAGPQGGAAGPVPPPAPRRRAAQGADHRDRPGGHRPDARTPGAASASRPARSPTCRPPRPTTRSPTSSPPDRWSSSPGAPTSPSRRPRPPPRCETVLDASPGAKVLPALRRGNVVGAIQLGLTPQDGGLDAAGILTAAADGRIDLLVLLGADPLDDFPDADLARRALAGARRVISVDTFLTELDGRRRRRAGGRRVRREVRHDDEPRGPRHDVGQKVSVAGTARPDWMIAVELAELLEHVDVADTLTSLDTITDTIAATVPAYAAATRAALAFRARRGARRAAVRRGVRAGGCERERPRPLRLSAGALAQAVRPGRDDGAVPVARPVGAAEQRRTCTRSISTAIGVSDGTEVRIVALEGHGRAADRGRRQGAPRFPARAVQRRGGRDRRHPRHHRAGHRRAGGALS